MNILLAHNYYGSTSPSGENQVFEAEARMLQQHDNTVSTFIRYSDTIRVKGAWGVVEGAFSTPCNPFAAKSMRDTLQKTRPDVVHVHNTFPLLSPAIFHAIGNQAARVLTLHNYRLFCPAAIPMRNGVVCTKCLDCHSVWPAVCHGCYRESRLATLSLAFSVELHRRIGTWENQVDAFIVLSDFQKNLMVEAGLPEKRVHVKPNFFEGDPRHIPWNEKDDAVVFAGRLSPEKGVEHLVKAWITWGTQAPELRILGDGPLRGKLSLLADKHPEAKIRFYGQVSSEKTIREIATAKLLVLPSVCFETFGMVIVEAFAFGTPVAVSDLGPLSSIVHHNENGVVFSAGNPESLLRRVRTAWLSGNLESLGHGARASFESLYTEDMNYEMLMAIYEKARSARR